LPSLLSAPLDVLLERVQGRTNKPSPTTSSRLVTAG
jgi:hypothetical protein